MEKFILTMDVKWKEIQVGSVPQSEIPVEWDWILDFVKKIFINKIKTENPYIMKDVFLTIISEFYKSKELEKIVIMKEWEWETEWEMDFFFNIAEHINSSLVFSIQKQDGLTIEYSIRQLLIQNENNPDLLLQLSFFVFSWLSPEEFWVNEESVEIAFNNFTEALSVKLIEE